LNGEKGLFIQQKVNKIAPEALFFDLFAQKFPRFEGKIGEKVSKKCTLFELNGVASEDFLKAC
jgi:hypothetical protein